MSQHPNRPVIVHQERFALGLSLTRRWLLDLARRWFGRKPHVRDDRRRATLQLEQLEVRLVPSLSTLASFNGTNGIYPTAVALDASGNLFGTTTNGGASGDGTVFELANGSTSITTLASFSGSNGADPTSGVILDSSGNLFGTTSSGGAFGYGTIFEVAEGSSAITTLASFSSTNGVNPSGLSLDGSGDLFGTTADGGGSGGAVGPARPAARERVRAPARSLNWSTALPASRTWRAFPVLLAPQPTA
jgi:uncharacterized repeat protein (TIGR03803 family)